MYEPEIAKILQKVIKPGYVCLEIGACCGEHTTQLSELVGRGKVISIEPAPNNIAQLELLSLPNVSIVQAAMADFVGHAQLFQGRGGSNFEYNLRGTDVDGNKTKPQCDVEVSTVDTLLDGNRCDIMLIDTEGHAGKVLLGACSTIKVYQPILVLEVHDDGEWQEIQDNIDNYKFYNLKLEEITDRSYFTLGLPASESIDYLILSSHEHAKYDVIHEKYEIANHRQINFLSTDDHGFCKLWRQFIESNNVLEIGVGSAETLQWFVNNNHRFSAIDISSVAVENCKKMFPDHDIRRSNARSLPFADNAFEVVQHLDGMEHIPRKWEIDCLREALRVSNKYVIYSNACGDAYLDHCAMNEGFDAVHINIKNSQEWSDFYTNHVNMGYEIIFSASTDGTYYVILEL